ncbi:MAG TPA: glutathione S-transferase family protein [Acetobacteraceae bacterium]|nr:glutathione S-transferase family protein [Acetobacteraceae bacterium]
MLSTFADFDTMLELGPLGKVPVFVRPDGERLWDSRAILDFLHEQASRERRLLPRHEPARYRVLRAEATALGLAEKTYERLLEFARRAPRTTTRCGWYGWSDRSPPRSPGWKRTSMMDSSAVGSSAWPT